MSKRRDSKKRILQNGESQRKDGKYEFKYVDANGTRRSAYSWKLVATDRVPEGKRCELSLREMEKQIFVFIQPIMLHLINYLIYICQQKC